MATPPAPPPGGQIGSKARGAHAGTDLHFLVSARAPSPATLERVPYAFARMHGVLPLKDDGESVLVLARSDASVEGIAELSRVLQRPLKTLTVNAERFAAELATALQPGGRRSPSFRATCRATPISRGCCRIFRRPRICSAPRPTRR